MSLPIVKSMTSFLQALLTSDDKSQLEVQLAISIQMGIDGVEGLSVPTVLDVISSVGTERLVRLSPLLYMQSRNGWDARDLRHIGVALWETHDRPCTNPIECRLHSLGPLWTAMDFGAQAQPWLMPALLCLVNDHPPRQWLLRLIPALSEATASHSLTTEDATSLLEAVLDRGVGDLLPNADLENSWRSILTVANSPETRARLSRCGSILIAGGMTSIIEPQLELESASSRTRLGGW